MHRILALAGVALALTVAACGAPPPLLGGVTVEPEAITPDRDGVADVARIRYAIGAPAWLTITFVGPDGDEHVFRDRRSRSPADDYEALFGGVIQGRMLHDGTYVVRLEAEPKGTGEPTVVERTLTVTGGDTEPPVLAGLATDRAVFSPNQDGLDDRLTISYRLDEPADVNLWLETVDGRRVTDLLEEQESAEDPGAPGPHQYDYDAGVDADAPPPPDGDYVIVAEARDATGNLARETLPLRIENGGQPRAALVRDVEWSATTVPLGATLSFTATVWNAGDTPIRTRGPESGFVYDNDSSFNQAAPAQVLLMARAADGQGAAWRRVAADQASVEDADLDLAAEPDPDPQTGSDRAAPLVGPAVEAATPEAIRVCGTVRDGGEPAAGAGLWAFEADGDGLAATTADGAGRFCFDHLPVAAAHERAWVRSPGAIRVGLEYDEKRSDLPYPYRWQLGRAIDLSVCDAARGFYLCLPPGATVQVTGGVRFVEPPFRRGTNVYLALMHEDVRKMHGPYGVQRITVEYETP